MVVVKKKKGESDADLIKRFSRKVYDADIVNIARKKARHTTKQEKRKEKRQERKHKDYLKRKRNKRQ